MRRTTILGFLLIAACCHAAAAFAVATAPAECTGTEDSKLLKPEELKSKLAGPVGGIRQLTIEAKPIAFDAGEIPAGITVKYAARLSPAQPDPHFCCWSALWVSENGSELKAVSDNGKWMTAAIRERADGSLDDLQATIGDLRCDHQSGRVSEKERREHDAAESMARLTDGSWLIGFECGERCDGEDEGNRRIHRIRNYPAGAEAEAQGLAGAPFAARPLPSDFLRQPEDRGPEGMTILAGDRPLVFSENHYRRRGNECGATRAWLAKRPWGEIAGPADWEELRYPLLKMPSQGSDPKVKGSDTCYEVAGVAALPPAQFGADSFVVLERRFEPSDVMHVRLAISNVSALRANYPPRPIFVRTEGKGLALPRRLLDNFEGIAVTPIDGGVAIWLIADDNSDADWQKPCSADNAAEPEGCQSTVLLRLDYTPNQNPRRAGQGSGAFAQPQDRD
jgi:hypothetical protein